MADEEVKVEEKPVEEIKQEELPLEAKAEVPAEEVKAEAEAAPVEEVKPEPVSEEPKVDWKDRELRKKHAQIKDRDRLLAEKEAELAALRAIAERTNKDQVPAPQHDIQPDIQREAAKLVAQQKYIEDCNKTAQDGEKKYGGGWKDAVSTLETLGGFDADTMIGVLATDDPAKVFYELGKNPDNYHRIMELPPARRIIEMGKLAMQSTPAKQVSNAPAPVSPVGGKAAPAKETLSDGLDDDKWYAIRQAQRAEYKKKHHSPTKFPSANR